MKPTEILRRYKDGISLIDDCVLEIIDSFEAPITIQKIVLKCVEKNVSSPATTQKAIGNLIREGLVRTAKPKGENDNRKHWVEPTAVGKRRISSY